MPVYEILKKKGYQPTSENYRSYINLWLSAYQNDIPDFHRYSEFNGSRRVKRERKTLGMPKKICEDWADTLVNEDVRITVEDSFQEKVEEVLDNNMFYHRYPELIEKTFALGTGATTQYIDENNEIKINYISANNIYPLEIRNGVIESVAFASIIAQDVLYLQIHENQLDHYIVRNEFYDISEQEPKEIVLEGIEQEFVSEEKLFQIIKPAIANNIDLYEPLGLSVYANAMDELKSTDEVYNSLDREIRAGRMKTYVMSEGFDVKVDLDSNEPRVVPIFDDKQDEFYLLPESETFEDGSLIKHVSPTLRTEQQIDTLQTNLRLLGRKVGLGDDYYSFKEGSIYTNTSQVISSNSRFYKTRQKHTTLIANAVTDMIRAIHYLLYNRVYEGDVTIDFDDSIIEDRETIEKQALMEYNAGLISKVEYFVRTRNFTEEQAEDFVRRQEEYEGLEVELELEEG